MGWKELSVAVKTKFEEFYWLDFVKLVLALPSTLMSAGICREEKTAIKLKTKTAVVNTVALICDSLVNMDFVPALQLL